MLSSTLFPKYNQTELCQSRCLTRGFEFDQASPDHGSGFLGPELVGLAFGGLFRVVRVRGGCLLTKLLRSAVRFVWLCLGPWLRAWLRLGPWLRVWLRLSPELGEGVSALEPGPSVSGFAEPGEGISDALWSMVI